MIALALAAVLLGATPAAPREPLRVCADANDPPFSTARGDGFENRIAAVLARELRRPLALVPVPLRRGFVRQTLGAGRCDVLMGVPAGFERVTTTRPYYRSTYVFVARRGGPAVASLDDPALRRVRVGIELVGDDGANPPAERALATRGIVENVVGFPVYGDYREAAPGAGALAAVRDGDVDVAVVWGPRAGAFARANPGLALAPVAPSPDGGVPFAFSVAIGVRKGDVALRDALDRALVRRRAEVAAILDDFGVPRLPLGASQARPRTAEARP